MSSFDGKTPGLMDIFLFNWLQNAIYWELPPFSRTNKKKNRNDSKELLDNGK